MTQTNRILCFGDSLTWGWKPAASGLSQEASRYSSAERWTGVLASALGAGFEIIEEGLPGRVTSFDDPADELLNGARYFPIALASHAPLDFVLILLGTNDTQTQYRRTANDIATGVSRLVRQVPASVAGRPFALPQVLIVCPPAPSHMPEPWLAEMFQDASATFTELPSLYQNVARYHGASFLDAGTVLTTDGADGLHFSTQNNLDLGRALAALIRSLLDAACS